MKTSRHLLLAILAVAAPTGAFADALVLRDGTRLEGRVEQIPGTEDRVAFTSGTGRIEFPLNRVTEVVEEDDATDYARIGSQFLKVKNFPAAVKQFQKALELNPSHADASEGLKIAQASIAGEQGERERLMQEQIGKELEGVPALITNESFDDAEALLRKVVDGKSTDQQRITAQRLMRDLYLAWGFSRYDRLDFKGAEEKYLRVQEMDPTNREAREKLLLIWRNDATKKPVVLKAYQQKLAEEPNNLEYNRTVGDLMYDFERFGEAIEPFSKVAAAPRYAGMGYEKKLLNAYRQEVAALADQGKLDEAIATFEKMLGAFPNEDTAQLISLRYDRDRQKLADVDWQGKALLVKRLNEAGLTQFATREAQLILRYDPQNEIAESILRGQAQAEYTRIEDSVREGQYVVARDMASQFLANYTRYPDLTAKAQELYNRADIEAKREAKAAREQAKEMAQRGIEYYNEATRNAEQLQSTERRNNSLAINNKGEAIKYSRRAIEHFEAALKLDPTVGPPTGMDVLARLSDAKALYNRLTDRPSSVPTVRNRRPVNGRG